MNVNDLLLDIFGRLPDLIRSTVDGLSPEQLRWAPAPGANTVGWLVWHLTRIQDDHVAEVAGEAQVWESGEWAVRFGLQPGTLETGWAHTPDQVAALQPESGRVLVEYYDAVARRTGSFVAALTPDDLDRVVDERWDPPVTLGVRLVSVAEDDLQHVGQAAYLRGLILRR